MTGYYQLIQREEQQNGSVIAHYRSTELAQGAWNPHEQHMAPATGIICEEIYRFQPREDMRIGRVSLDIWGLKLSAVWMVKNEEKLLNNIGKMQQSTTVIVMKLTAFKTS